MSFLYIIDVYFGFIVIGGSMKLPGLDPAQGRGYRDICCINDTRPTSFGAHQPLQPLETKLPQ